jgi:hypothetical protein
VPQAIISYKLEVEHIKPKSKGGTDTEENLCLACRQCNSFKASKVYGFDTESSRRAKLFNPNKQIWSEHFSWDKEQTSIIGKTPCGRATILALKMNNDWQINARKFWKLTGIFPPEDVLV